MPHPPQAVRLFNPVGVDRVAVVSTEPASGAAKSYLIRLALGAGPGPLQKGTVFGPFAEEEVLERFTEVVERLRSDGFLPTGMHDLLLGLQSTQSATRARAALGLGWRRAIEAVEPIMAALPKAVDEVCSFLDALGAIGDPRALPLLREYAGRKLLSRRRSAVEALRNLNDAEGLAAAGQHALERLPAPVREAYLAAPSHQTDSGAIGPITKALQDLELSQRGLALDTLYELATPLSVVVVRSILEQAKLHEPGFWRYVKSIHKRAMLRHDDRALGWLNHAIERAGRDCLGTQATVKSGYDGVARSLRIFSRKTQQFMRRLSWRYLRLLATHRANAYAWAAAEALIAFTPDDAQTPQGFHGQLSSCYLLNCILWSAGSRLVLSERSLRYRFRDAAAAKVPENIREEPYPALWDAQPGAFVRILAAGRLPEVHAFAVAAVTWRHPDVLKQATNAEIVAFLGAPHEPTVKLGLEELERRFDPLHPDWPLLAQLLRDDRPASRELGQRWLRDTAPLWLKDVEQTLIWLGSPHPDARSLAVELVVASLRQPDVAAGLRSALALRLKGMFQQASLPEEGCDGFVRVAREGVIDELAALYSVKEIMDWIDRAPVATLSIAGELLARHPEAIVELGMERVGQLAQHAVAAVRSGAHRVLQSAKESLRNDPALLFLLVESTWDDTRQAAVRLLREIIDPPTLSFDRLLGLLDSCETEVQDLGKELLTAQLRDNVAFRDTHAVDIVYRLVEHPLANMRPFVLDLVVKYLPGGAQPLAKVVTFFRAALFDLWPSRTVKEAVLDFVTRRGLVDEHEAALAVPILADVARTQCRGDFERALEGLVRIKLAHPDVPVPVRLQLGDMA